MQNDKVRVAIVGMGDWGQAHLEAFAALPQCELTAIVSSRADHCNALADKFGVPGRYQTADALWQRDDIDLVSVVTAEADHLAPVLGALHSGKHVIVEKPVSTKLDEARAMLDAAKQNNRFLMPGHVLRFDPHYAEIYESIRAGKIGKLGSIFSRRSREQWKNKVYGRVHLAWVLMAHDIDQAIWWTGNENGGGRVRSVRAWHRTVIEGAHPDLLWACLEFDNDAVAVLQANWLVPDAVDIGRPDAAEVIGSGGILNLELGRGGVQLWHEKGRHNPDLHLHHRIGGHVTGALKEQLGYLCDCVLKHEPPTRVPFEDAIHGIQVVEAVIQSAHSGETVRL